MIKARFRWCSCLYEKKVISECIDYVTCGHDVTVTQHHGRNVRTETGLVMNKIKKGKIIFGILESEP